MARIRTSLSSKAEGLRVIAQIVVDVCPNAGVVVVAARNTNSDANRFACMAISSRVVENVISLRLLGKSSWKLMASSQNWQATQAWSSAASRVASRIGRDIVKNRHFTHHSTSFKLFRFGTDRKQSKFEC